MCTPTTRTLTIERGAAKGAVFQHCHLGLVAQPLVSKLHRCSPLVHKSLQLCIDALCCKHTIQAIGGTLDAAEI